MGSWMICWERRGLTSRKGIRREENPGLCVLPITIRNALGDNSSK